MEDMSAASPLGSCCGNLGFRVLGFRVLGFRAWVLVKGINLSCYNKATIILFTVDPYYGDLSCIPTEEPRKGRAAADPNPKQALREPDPRAFAGLRWTSSPLQARKGPRRT